MNVLGIMSGTSMDGVDYALCRIDARSCKLLELWSARFPSRLQARIQSAAAGAATSHEAGQLHHDLGRFYAAHATKSAGKARPSLVGLHGQTVFHNPDRRAPATWQIGESAYLAEALRVPVVSNFRAADLAAGGQGAPLATAFHVRIFGRQGRHVCVNNLGGISNVTSIGAQGSVRAFDTGPGNVLLDLAARHYSDGRLACDRHGRWAARGRVCEALVREWLRHPYFRARPPKSTGREVFGEPFFAAALKEFRRRRLDHHDALATLTEFTARSIALNYARHLPAPPNEVILCGGGAANPSLVAALQHALAQSSTKVRILTSADRGWPLPGVEPAAFALLAWLRWQGIAGNLPVTTGARRGALLGQISSG
jgi:anhydro-N-acetylmuramic acid kinase